MIRSTVLLVAGLSAWAMSTPHVERATGADASPPVQPRSASASVAPASSRSVPLAGLRSPSPYRQLAPGVLRDVAPDKMANETYSRHDVVELLKVNPAYDWAKDIRFDHAIWALEFSYKPVRFIEVDVPQPSGGLQRKTVWYLVYRVKNPGPEPVTFYPWFVLESKDPKIPKAYPDRLVPAAIPAIVAREDRNRRLANTVEIAGSIAAGKEVWGVATWTDIDPKIDSFSIYVSGLTNAYRWRDDPQKGRLLVRKTLELNFWRPGDEFFEHEGEIRLGGPDQPDHRWIYR
jgi:hypothetical protein